MKGDEIIDKWGTRLRPAPMAFGRLEVAAMRLLFGLLLWFNLPVHSKFLDQANPQPKPNGLAAWGIDFSWAAEAAVMDVMKIVLVPVLIIYTLGVLRWLALPYMLVLSMAVGTLKNSQGSISHVYQIITMILIVQCGLHLYIAVRRLAKSPHRFGEGWNLDRAEVFASQSAVAAIYLTTAITKLVRSEGAWVWQLRNVGVDLEKTWSQAYHNELVLDAPGWAVAIREFVTENPWAAVLLFAPGLFAEFFAFLGLYGRWRSLIMGVLLVVLHVGAIYVMQLEFWQNIACLLIFFVNVPYWLVLRWRRGSI
jgi:hypothetical protein